MNNINQQHKLLSKEWYVSVFGIVNICTREENKISPQLKETNQGWEKLLLVLTE